jgi:DNA repair protein RadD
MAVTLRKHQVIAVADIDKLENQGYETILCVQPTGSGKTIIKAYFAQREYVKRNGMCIIFAHRDVLLEQISGSLCLMGVPHGFICSAKTQRDITNLNLEKYGDSFYDKTSPVICASSQTFASHVKRGMYSELFLDSVVKWLMDEAHHLTIGSTWAKCIDALPNATGVGFTATPLRGDSKGLGKHADGYFEELSVTTNMFNLIQDGTLTLYKIFATSQINIKGIKKDKDGELNKKQLRIKTKEADITGSAVEQYLKHLNGQPVITFCINIEHCIEVAEEFNANGVPSVAVSSKSDPKVRANAVADVRSGRIMNLVNCDLFGEGFDAPSVAGVIMLRRTTSYSLYKQQFGRMLRPSKETGKVFGILLDHVGNTQHMMTTYKLSHPHDDPTWTLDRLKEKKNNSEDDEDGVIETITCANCGYFAITEDFEENDHYCPDCGHLETEDENVARIREIRTAKGELVELDIDMIGQLIKQREDNYKSVTDYAANLSDNFHAKNSAVNRYAARQSALNVLRHWIQEWSTKKWKDTGKPVKMIPIEFELEFKINIIKAQVLPEPQMNKLTSKIQQSMRLS